MSGGLRIIRRWFPVVAAFVITSCYGNGDLSERGEGRFPASDARSGETDSGPNSPYRKDRKSCEGMAADGMCLAVKYVAYVEDAGEPVIRESEVASNLELINSIWGKCGIRFILEEYLTVRASDFGLRHGPQTASELYQIRRKFEDGESFLIVSTGYWTGSLGKGRADAWTQPPPEGPFGVMLDEDVATYPYIIAHELGHYLNLDHIEDEDNVMNPIIYKTSLDVNAEQCAGARDAVDEYWASMRRT